MAKVAPPNFDKSKTIIFQKTPGINSRGGNSNPWNTETKQHGAETLNASTYISALRVTKSGASANITSAPQAFGYATERLRRNWGFPYTGSGESRLSRCGRVGRMPRFIIEISDFRPPCAYNIRIRRNCAHFYYYNYSYSLEMARFP